MDRDMVGRQLDDLPPGDSMEIDKDTHGMLFTPGEAAGVIDPRTLSAATKFAQDHNCRFLFNERSKLLRCAPAFARLPLRGVARTYSRVPYARRLGDRVGRRLLLRCLGDRVGIARPSFPRHGR